VCYVSNLPPLSLLLLMSRERERERRSEIIDFSDFCKDQILLAEANVSGAETE
jgi:hypothetical protein